jgi:hypothetical protein
LAALKYLYFDRYVLMHGHEPLVTDNTALPSHTSLRRGADGVMRETP